MRTNDKENNKKKKKLVNTGCYRLAWSQALFFIFLFSVPMYRPQPSSEEDGIKSVVRRRF